MKFLGQGFQKSEHEQDRHTDATERITTATFAVVKIDFCSNPKLRDEPHFTHYNSVTE